MSFVPPPQPGREPLGQAARGIENARVSGMEQHAALNRNDEGVLEPRRGGLLLRLLSRLRSTPQQ